MFEWKTIAYQYSFSVPLDHDHRHDIFSVYLPFLEKRGQNCVWWQIFFCSSFFKNNSESSDFVWKDTDLKCFCLLQIKKMCMSFDYLFQNKRPPGVGQRQFRQTSLVRHNYCGLKSFVHFFIFRLNSQKQKFYIIIFSFCLRFCFYLKMIVFFLNMVQKSMQFFHF